MKWWLKCMRNYVNFRGRARRREFWMFALCNTLVCLILLLVFAVSIGVLAYKNVGSGEDATEHLAAYAFVAFGAILLAYVWMLATLLPGLAVRVRRLHDIGLSGKWLLGYYALCMACLHWMSTSTLRFYADGALEGLSEVQSAAALWIVLRPTLLAALLLSAVGSAAMCIGSERGGNRFGTDPKATDAAASGNEITV